MTFQSYNLNIPASGDNPSNDQPLMQTNTNSISALVSLEHFGFNNNSGGLHKQVTMPLQAAVPGTATVGAGVLYTKTASSISPSTETDLFYSPDSSGNQYQLTRTITAQFTSFGTNINYAPPVANQNGGWTFLPGGLILQYGQMNSTGSNTTVVFPFAFPTTLMSIQATRVQAANSGTTYGINTETNSGFIFSASSNTVGTRFYWIAVGK